MLANMAKEFKDFISKGNVIDLAVGIIMGAAFTTVVNSLVNDVLMPPIGKAIGGVNFSELKIDIGGPLLGADGKPVLVDGKEQQAAIFYGKFIQAIINFLIIAFCVFQLVKVMNKLKGPKKEAAAPEPTASEKLLAEIRDELRKKK